MSADICERYAKVAARWALQNPIAALYGDGPKAEKLARIWGEAIAKRLTENVRDEEMEQLRAERDALKAELAEAKEAYLAVIEAAELRGTVRHLERVLAEARAAIERSRTALAAFDGRGVNNFDIPTPREVLDAWRAALDAPQRPEDARDGSWLDDLAKAGPAIWAAKHSDAPESPEDARTGVSAEGDGQ